MYLKLIMGSTNCTVIKHVMFVDYDVILVYFHKTQASKNYICRTNP